MASRMSGDILYMVLSCILTISYANFETGSLSLWGRNDHVSTSTLLLVSREWYRHGTPLLYKFVVIRSIGQAYALARTLTESPRLGNYVRNIRLEGAYNHLDHIFQHCNNLDSVVLLFRDIKSEDVVHKLCSSLGRINPRRFILIDFPSEDKSMNRKKKAVFDALCNSIPEWTRLFQFHYPYTEQGKDLDSKRERLKAALRLSPVVRELFCSTSCPWEVSWTQLAIKDDMHLYLRSTMDPKEDEKSLKDFVAQGRAEYGIPNLGDRVHVVRIETDDTMLPSTPLSLHHYIPQTLPQQPPYALEITESDGVSRYNILQGDTALRCFVGSGTETDLEHVDDFVVTAGRTIYALISFDRKFAHDIARSRIRNNDNQLHSWDPQPSFNWGFPIEEASTISTLNILFEIIPFDKPFEKVELVKVTAVEYAFLSAHGIGIIELKVSIDDLGLANHNEPMELLLLCPSLKKLTLVGMRNSKESKRPLRCPEFLLFPTRGNRTLETIVICAGRHGYKVRSGDVHVFVDELFPGLAQDRPLPNRFPKLREIQIIGYQWPINHHYIEKDFVIQIGQLLKESFGVDITDSSGQPFRQRVTAPRRFK